MFENIFITGGTGLIGQEVVNQLINKHGIENITVYSRNINEQFKMKEKFNEKVRYVVGDIRDRDRLIEAMKGHDAVIHLAAIKFIDIAEENPSETIKTNVIGTQNVLDAAIIVGAKKIVFSSSDKACNPSTIYGVTKLLGEKIIRSSINTSTSGSIFRFANVINTNGSIFQKWKYAKEINITSLDATRFFISIEDAAEVCLYSLYNGEQGDIFIPEMKSAKIIDIANIFKNKKINIIGMRKNEKIHEEMISKSDMGSIIKKDKYLVIKNDNMFTDISLNSLDNQNYYSNEEIKMMANTDE